METGLEVGRRQEFYNDIKAHDPASAERYKKYCLGILSYTDVRLNLIKIALFLKPGLTANALLLFLRLGSRETIKKLLQSLIDREEVNLKTQGLSEQYYLKDKSSLNFTTLSHLKMIQFLEADVVKLLPYNSQPAARLRKKLGLHFYISTLEKYGIIRRSTGGRWVNIEKNWRQIAWEIILDSNACKF